MANTIKIKQSATLAKIPEPADLQQGELAINTLDEVIYTKNSSSVVVDLTQKINRAGTTSPTTTDDSAAGYSVGSVWIDTTNDKAYVCVDSTASSAVWSEMSVANAVSSSTEFIATASQTTFAVTYTVDALEVYLNGVRLDTTDYTATNGTSVILDTGAALNDTVFVQAFNMVDLVEDFLPLAGGTMTGTVTLKGVTETSTNTSTTSTLTPTLTDGTLYTTSGTITVTMALPTTSNIGQSFTLIKSTNTTLVFPISTYHFSSATAPTTVPADVEIYTFVCDGTNWLGMQGGIAFGVLT